MFPYIDRDQSVVDVQPSELGLAVTLSDNRTLEVSIPVSPKLDRLRTLLETSGLDVFYMPNGMTPELWHEVGGVLRTPNDFRNAIKHLPGIRAQIEMDFNQLFSLPLRAHNSARQFIYVGHRVDFYFDVVSPPHDCPPGRFAYNLFSEGDQLLKTWVDPELRRLHLQHGELAGHFLS